MFTPGDTAVTQSALSPPDTSRLARLDVDQYHRMLEKGILPEGAPIELLDGLLLYKDRSAVGEDPMSIGKRHSTAVNLLARVGGALVAPRGSFLQTQNPVTIGQVHEPEPDGAVVRGGPRDYVARHPRPEDVSCVFEVSESSLEHDRTHKLRIYASAGISQYVIVNLVDDRLEVFEQPDARKGRYRRQAFLDANASLSLVTPDGERVEVPVRDLLP